MVAHGLLDDCQSRWLASVRRTAVTENCSSQKSSREGRAPSPRKIVSSWGCPEPFPFKASCHCYHFYCLEEISLNVCFQLKTIFEAWGAALVRVENMGLRMNGMAINTVIQLRFWLMCMIRAYDQGMAFICWSSPFRGNRFMILIRLSVFSEVCLFWFSFCFFICTTRKDWLRFELIFSGATHAPKALGRALLCEQGVAF